MKGQGLRNLIISLALALSGCATVTKDVQLRHEGKPEAELVVYREPELLGQALYFGESGKSYLVLKTNEYARVKIDAGMHEFEARITGGGTFKLAVNLEKGKTTCIKASRDPAAVLLRFAQIMENPERFGMLLGMRPQGTAQQLERRRRQAIRLLKAGKTLSAVARALSASVSSVFRWYQT